jgi:hypothetical protein
MATDALPTRSRRRNLWGLLWLVPSWLVLLVAQSWWTVFRTWNDFGDTPEWSAAFDHLRTTVTVVGIVTAVLTVAAPVSLWRARRAYAWSIPALTVLGLVAMWALTLGDVGIVDNRPLGH